MEGNQTESSRTAVLLEGEKIHIVWNKAWHRGAACPLYCFPFLLKIS